MSTPKTVRTVALVVGAVWTAVLYLSHIQLPTVGQQIVANTPTALLLITIAFDLWLWKLPVVHKLHSRPQIGGLWDVTITPHQDSHIPVEGNLGPIAGTATIEQTFWTLKILMKTSESESVSNAESIAPDGGSRTRKVLTYTYTNTPQIAVRDRSPIHVGATMLTIEGQRPGTLNGIYWTGRLTIGDLSLIRTAR